LLYKIFLSYRYNIRNSKEEEEQNIKKIKNIKYNIENVMQKSIKYLYQRRLNEKLKKELEEVEGIYENIIESIHGVAEKTLGNKKKEGVVSYGGSMK